MTLQCVAFLVLETLTLDTGKLDFNEYIGKWLMAIDMDFKAHKMTVSVAADRHTDRQTDRLTDGQTDRQTDDSGYHLLTCKTGGGPVWSHESILTVWSDCFGGLHSHHRREPRSRYTTTDNRPDIIFLTQTLETTLTFISLTHPWSSDIFPSSAGVSGAAAERRAERKKEKHSKQQLPGGIIATVTPLVMEHVGPWGIDGWKLLCKLSKKSSDKWDNQTLRSLSISGPNAFLFSSRSVMLESSLKSYIRCPKTTDVTSLPPSTLATSWYWRLCLYTVVFKCSPHFVLHEFQF